MSRYTYNSPENNADRAAHRSKVEADGLRAEIARLNRQLIDGDAAMRDRVESLTEQVAQLTRERDAAKQDAEQWRYTQQTGAETRANRAEREVARLTEALAAAERRGAHFDEQCAANLVRAEAAESEVVELTCTHDALHEKLRDEQTRAESAERDRDAANALLRAYHEGTYDLATVNAISAHLSGQPAPLPCVSGYVDAFEWRARAEAAERDRDAARALVRDWSNSVLEHLYERTAALLSSQPAAPARTDSGVAAMTALHQMAAAPAHTASEARVRELESELTDLRRSYSENTEKMILAEARVRELEAELAEVGTSRFNTEVREEQLRIELAALRERVAFAIAWLTDIEPKPHSKSWNALEVLRGD